MVKNIAACIFLKNERAVAGFDSDDIISESPIDLAKHYSNNGYDELIVFDLSATDSEHDKSIGLIKEIASEIEIPLIAGGNVKRVEDVKKLLYAGADKAMLNYSKTANIELTTEVSKRFGKEKIAVCVKNTDEVNNNCELIEEYADSIIGLDKLEIDKINTAIPIIYLINTIDFAAVVKTLSDNKICAVTGEAFNNPSTDINSLKAQLKSAGINVSSLESRYKWSDLKLNSDGMLPVIVQDYKTNEVLMLAYMNEDAFNETIRTGKMTYFSRSRNELWVKGLTSGHYQYVKELTLDCDLDTLLAKVSQVGAACHTGNKTCFFNETAKRDYKELNPLKVFEDVYSVIKDRKENPKEGSYTNYLFDKGIDKILKKLGEEATEIIIAAKNPDPEEIKYEISDFLYHMMVLMADKGVSWEDITKELANR